MAEGGVNADVVIGKLRDKIGSLITENVMLETALEEAWEKIRKLEQELDTPTSEEEIAFSGDSTDAAPRDVVPRQRYPAQEGS